MAFRTETKTTYKKGKRTITTRKIPIKKEPRVKIKKIGGKKPKKTSRGKGKRPVYTKEDKTPVISNGKVVALIPDPPKKSSKTYTKEELTGVSGAPVEEKKEPGILESTYKKIQDEKLGTTKPFAQEEEKGIFGLTPGPHYQAFKERHGKSPFETLPMIMGGAKLKIAIGKKVPPTIDTILSQYTLNTKTASQTASWLSKAAKSLTNPTAAVGTLMAAIGSYPFAGFIKEEALQTLGFGVRTALDNNDLEGANLAIQAQYEILDPGLWDEIKANIPFVNVLDSLDNFYDAAKIKLSVDQKLVNDLKVQQETGESDDDKWTRLRQEQAAQEQANVDYYNSERKKLFIWERESRKKGMREDAAFWAKEAAKQKKLEEEDREAIAKFWEAYKKEQQKFNDNRRPSKLNFGFI